MKVPPPEKNLPARHCIGDIVFMKADEDVLHNYWRLARVVQTYPSVDGYVRKVRLVLAEDAMNGKGKRVKPLKYLDRPVQKLVLLQESET